MLGFLGTLDDTVLVDIAATSQQAKSPSLVGLVIDLRALRDEKAVHIIREEASRQQVIVDLQRALGAGIMTQAQAAKTRERSNWVETHSFGRLGRVVLAVLKNLQHHGAGSLSNLQRNALRVLIKG